MDETVHIRHNKIGKPLDVMSFAFIASGLTAKKYRTYTHFIPDTAHHQYEIIWHIFSTDGVIIGFYVFRTSRMYLTIKKCENGWHIAEDCGWFFGGHLDKAVRFAYLIHCQKMQKNALLKNKKTSRVISK